MVILWYLKNNFIFLVKKIFIFVNDFKKKQNAFPPYPIVTDSLVSFQYEGQLSFV